MGSHDREAWVRSSGGSAFRELADRVAEGVFAGADVVVEDGGELVAEVLGDESGVTGALLRCNDGKEVKIDISGFFLAIGHHPNTELFRDQLQLDAEGYIKVEPGTSITNIEGVFAAGDVRDPHYRQAVTAAASGCIAAIDCERFLLSRAN